MGLLKRSPEKIKIIGRLPLIKNYRGRSDTRLILSKQEFRSNSTEAGANARQEQIQSKRREPKLSDRSLKAVYLHCGILAFAGEGGSVGASRLGPQTLRSKQSVCGGFYEAMSCFRVTGKPEVSTSIVDNRPMRSSNLVDERYCTCTKHPFEPAKLSPR